MLDDDHGVARVAQAVQHGEQQIDVLEMQARGRLVEDVERASGVALGEFERELHALRLSARERGGGLAELDVAEAHFEQGLELALHRGDRVEELVRRFHRHLQDLVDVLALELHFERLAVVALAVAGVAGHVDVRKEMHLDLDDPVALAGFAAPAFHVEGEAPRPVAALARHRHAREKLADGREEGGVGGRVGARRAADRALVDAHRLVEELQPLDRIVRGGLVCRAVELARDGVIERVVDERRFARARDAGDAHEQAHRQRKVDILQIVPARPAQPEDPRPVETAPVLGHGDLERAGEVLPGEGGGVPADLLGRALRDHLAAVLARSRSHVEHMIGGVDRLFVVLDHDDGVADVAQVLERGEEASVVALVQADRGFVEHVHDAGEPRADLAREADTLRLAARERVRGAVERKIVKADVVEEVEPRDDLVDDFLGDRLLPAG